MAKKVTTIYVVTNSFTDGRFEAAFTTPELAEKYKRRRNGYVEEYELDSVNSEWLDGKVNCYSVWLRADNGNTVLVDEIVGSSPQESTREQLHKRVIYFGATIYAESQGRATEIARERWAIEKAKEQEVEV